METKTMPKNANFCCNLCDFKCFKKSNYETHNKTKKHVQRLSGTNLENAGTQKHADYTCKCGKKFLTSSGLWKHENKGKCENNDNIKDDVVWFRITVSDAKNKDYTIPNINSMFFLKTYCAVKFY